MHALGAHLAEAHLSQYSRKCAAVHQKLVHANLAAHVVWEILEFQRIAGDIFLPPERDLLLTLLTNSADRVVVTAVALTERKKNTLNFGALATFLEKNVYQESKPTVLRQLAEVNLDERKRGLLGRAVRTRHELIAHFNADQAMRAATSDRRLLINDVLDLQDEMQDIFDLLRVDETIGYTSHTASSRQMLRLLASAYGPRIRGVSGELLGEMLAPGTTLVPNISPWRFGRQR